MCGRYYVDDEVAREIRRIVQRVDDRLKKETARDIHPSQTALVLTGKQPELTAEEMKWGFLSYDRKGLLINARAETALDRKTFRESILHRRCIIPAKHFYEWDREKNKVTFLREDAPVLYMAGFYRSYQNEEHFIIITTQANASVEKIHDRMPLILEEKELEDWVYEDGFMEYALHKTPVLLKRYQEYEQQSLF